MSGNLIDAEGLYWRNPVFRVAALSLLRSQWQYAILFSVRTNSLPRALHALLAKARSLFCVSVAPINFAIACFVVHSTCRRNNFRLAEV